MLVEWWMNSCMKPQLEKKDLEVRVKRLGNGWVLWERPGREEGRRTYSECSGRDSRSPKGIQWRTILPRHFFSPPKNAPRGCLYSGDIWNRITSLPQKCCINKCSIFISHQSLSIEDTQQILKQKGNHALSPSSLYKITSPAHVFVLSENP